MSGADKVIDLDPPGTIGLYDPSAIVMLRLNEEDDDDHPADSAGSLNDLDTISGASPTTVPAVTAGVTGRGRAFVEGDGLSASDRVSGTTLLNRDVTVQAILSWDIVGQFTTGEGGTIVSRGQMNGVAAQAIAFGLVLDVVDAPSSRGQMSMIWEAPQGSLRLVQSPEFTLLPGKFTMLTATRRWISPTSVVVRFYIGDQLLGEVASAFGAIAGGTTGTTTVGYLNLGSNGSFLIGVIDELMVLDHEISIEEIEATWKRITVYQPLGYQLFLELHDPGFPIPLDRGSDAQLDTRMTGVTLGFAAAQFENLRANFLPGRAYGSVLEQWEELVRVSPQPTDDIDTRRQRAVARFRQRRGSSIDGLKDALVDLIGDAEVSDLQFLAFDNTVREDFSSIRTERWDLTPGPSGGTMTSVSGAGRLNVGGLATHAMTGVTRDWVTMRQSVGGDGKQAQAMTKMVFTGSNTYEAGIYFSEEGASGGDFILLGLELSGGNYRVVTESFIAGVSQGLVVQAVIGAVAPAAIWLHLFQTTTDGIWKAAWSTTSGTAGFTTSANITHPTVAHWSGCYIRGTASASGITADFDDHVLRSPFGSRPFNAYVLLDEGGGFTPDSDGASSVIRAIKHAFVTGTFITTTSVLCDNTNSGCDAGPMGGI